MRVLFDVVHPAHVHFFRHLRTDLLRDGHEVWVVSRDKEVTLDLLGQFEIPHISTGRAITGGLLSRARELVHRVGSIRRVIREFKPDIVLTRNPSGVQAARLSGVTGVFDTDDGSAAGIHFWAARPFADIIVTPKCLHEDFGRRHRRYPGFKALAYLHPNRFRPDPRIRSELGIDSSEPLFLVRFSAYTASHDRAASGLRDDAKRILIAELGARGRVLISAENDLAEEFAPYALSINPDRFHHVLAAAQLCVGDSQTVAAEAAILGTPAFRLSSFSRRIDYLRVLEERYGLIKNFGIGQEAAFLHEVKEAISNVSLLARAAAAGRERLLRESVDVTSWYRDLVYELVQERSAKV